jgi:hypothetical protein
MSFEILDRTLAGNLNGPVTAAGGRYLLKTASCRGQFAGGRPD